MKKFKLDFGKEATIRRGSLLVDIWTGRVYDPPTSFTIILFKAGKKGQSKWLKVLTTIYLTANIWYGSQGNSKNEKRVRAKAKEIGMYTLHPIVRTVPYINPNKRIKILVEYNSPLGQFDINNKGFFWEKLFSDYIAPRATKPENRKLKDDNVRFMYDVEYKHIISEKHFIDFTISYETRGN